MADHQTSAASRAANTLRAPRFGDFTRPSGVSIDETAAVAAPQVSSQGLSSNPPGWMAWGSPPAAGSSSLGGGAFGNVNAERRGAAAEEYLQPIASASTFEGKQGSSALLQGSGEHDTWSSKSSALWSGDAPSPGLSSISVSQDIGRSPVRLRTNTKYESPKQSTEVPRSTSPFYRVGRGAPIAPSAAGFEVQNSRGRPMEMGQLGSQRFPAAGDNTVTAGSRHLSAVLSGMDNDEQSLRRGRGISNSRGIVPAADVSSVGRSESLPPQQRPNSTPPSHNPDQSPPPNGSGYPAYTHIPTSHAGNAILQGAIYPQGRYADPSRDTREAEMLARHLPAEDDGNELYQGRQRPTYPYSQTPPLNPNTMGYSAHLQFGDHQYQRHAAQGSHVSSQWPDDSLYRNSEQYLEPYVGAEYVESYADRLRPHDRSGAMSPGDEYSRRGMGSPYYPATGTPPMDGFRSPSLGGGPINRATQQGQGALHPEKLRQQLLVASQQQQHPQNQLAIREPFFRQQYAGPTQYDYSGGYPNATARMQVTPYSGSMSPIVGATQSVARRHEDFSSLRSVLLEDFRSNAKSNKRYDLKDIYQHVVEFSGDQHGSRFIQLKLETANSDEKEVVFSEIRQNSLQLMTDVFGNYVIQKFFEHGNQLQKSILAKQMEGHVLTLSLQMYGCRVVQKALEHILTEQQATLVKELDGHVLKCVKDQNGNHVVQKAIERVPAEHIQFIIQAFKGQVQALAMHPYGCRVIQRMLEHCDDAAQASILKELHACTFSLVQDQYGNYVTQHVIEQGKPEDRAKIISLVTNHLLHFSKHKFASNVVEKSIAYGTPEQKREIVRVVTEVRPDGNSPLHLLMRDQYGNYVIQKLLTLLSGADRDTLVEQIKPQLQNLKKFTFGKQINAIEKLIFNNPPAPSKTTSPMSSALATPPLVATEPQSPDSTTVPIAKPGDGSTETFKPTAGSADN